MGGIAPLILNDSDVWRYVVKEPSHSRWLYPWEKGPRFTFVRMLEGSSSRCGRRGEEKTKNVLAQANQTRKS